MSCAIRVRRVFAITLMVALHSLLAPPPVESGLCAVCTTGPFAWDPSCCDFDPCCTAR